MLELYALKIDGQLSRTFFDQFLPCLSPEGKARAGRFHFFEDAVRFTAADVLTRSVIIKKLRCKNEAIVFERNPYGKPFLKDRSEVQFNKSHSGRWAVCAFDETPAGADIQQVRPVNFKLTKRYFSPLEDEVFQKKPAEEKTDYFFDIWTLKESYIKAVGKGLSLGLNTFSVIMEKDGIKVRSGYDDRYYLRQYNIDPAYKLAVCGERPEFPEKAIVISMDELMREGLD